MYQYNTINKKTTRKFPADKLEEVYNNIDVFSEEEDIQAKEILKAKNVDEIKKAWLKRV